MKKKDLLKTVTFASAILAAGAISFSGVEASADTLETTPTTANETETTTTNQVTEEQVAAAKAEASAIGDAVKHQETVVADALTTKQSAQAVEAATQTELVAAQEIAEAATPEAIQAVEAEIVEAETTVSETEDLLETANQEATTAQEQADQAQAVADTANTAYTEAQAQADAAQETVAQLENQTVNVDQAQANVDTAKQEVVSAEANVATAEQAVVKAKESDQSLAQEIADAKTVVDEAKVAESDAQKTVDGLEAQVAETASKVTEAQALVNSLQNEVSYTIDINLPQVVKDAVKKFMTTPKTLDTVAELSKVFDDNNVYDNLNSYWNVEISGDEQVNLNSLTDTQVEKMNQFVVDVYNKLAENIGLTKVTANTKLIEVAKLRSEKYDEINAPYEHNTTILRESQDKVFENNVLVGENITFPIVTKTIMTMREFLNIASEALQSFTFYDRSSEYTHWINIDTAQSIGVYSHIEENENHKVLDMTFDTNWLVMATYKDRYTIGGLDKNAIAANAEVHAADVTFTNESSSLTEATTQLALANVAQNRAQADLAQAVTALNEAKANIVSATNAYNTLLSTESETTKAQANLDAANTKLSEAQAKYEQAVDALDALTAQKAEQAQKLATAKTVLDQAQTKATSLYSDYRAKQAQADVLKTKVNQLNQEVQNLETDLANAKQAVVDAKAKLLGLQEAEANLVKAQEAYDKAVKAKDEACAVYQTELAKLTDLKNSFTLAANHYLTLSNLYKLQEQVKTPTEVTGDNQGTGGSSGSSTSGQNQNGTTVVTKGNSQAPLDQLDKPSAVKGTAVASASNGQVKYLDVANAPVQAASLPQTGSNESILSSLAGFTVLGLGLSLAIKRRKYTEE
ncbi:SEC10/PgrA surface exclusion domain-containing protein [Streptococcus suis]|uniref:SEC10/PgrA surface exclusion domain-containing protein n=1 Tax=Streptococcus suis TaxID=1307 RepID=UPI001C970142|nr:SEC10/PgrA surface exclusion domain-containing protein [Streptococcus suis]MBY5010198.1 SEC10/PgrA surface exclusion domain-containing protein [Streptococcus suis]MDG4518686.1 SEC10/PgrA surface exclusion domain-containing protein [Streptococcus suis]